jgi:hypothetical protein
VVWKPNQTFEKSEERATLVRGVALSLLRQDFRVISVPRSENPDLGHPVCCSVQELRFGAVFLGDFLTFAGEGPLTIEGLLFFADSLGDVVNLEVLEDVYAELSGAGDVDVSVLVEVGGDELGSGTGGSVDGEGVAGEEGVSRGISDAHGCDGAGSGFRG